MLNREKKLWGLAFALGVGLTPVLAAEKAPATISPDMRVDISRIDQGKQENEIRAGRLVSEANKLLIDSKYLEARDKYLAAIKIFESFPSPEFQKRAEMCRSQVVTCYKYMAEEAMSKAEERAALRDFEEAIRICKEALKYCPELKGKLQSRIDLYEKRQAHLAANPEARVETLLPNQKNQEYQIQVLMEQGRQLVAAGEYTRALRKFDNILLIDPYNADAIQNIKATYWRVDKAGLARYANEHRKLIAETEWKFAIPVVPESNSADAVNMLGVEPKVKEEREVSALQKKLDSIRIPRIDFEDVTISAAIKNLREQSRQQDPEQVGVNIFLRRDDGSAAALYAKLNAQNDMMGGPDGMGMGGPGMPPQMRPQLAPVPAADGAEPLLDENGLPIDNEQRISLLIQNQTLMDAIKRLCDTAKLRYRVEKYAVVIAPQSVAIDDMETRLFPLDRSPVDDPNNEQELKNYFIGNGVEFPTGSKIVYDPKITRLIVYNTVDNLQKIDTVIHELLDQQEPMVQILCKFIEISQDDLKELAFNYQLTVNGGAEANVLENGKYPRDVKFGPNSNELLRYYRDETNSSSDSSSSDPTYNSTFSYVWQNADGTAIVANLFALNQADSMDVLGAPRVTTLPGQPAHIEMVTERYFPEDWEIVDLPNNNTGGSGDGSNEGTSYWRGISADPQPNFESEPTKLGIVFDIQPEIDKERRTITAHVLLPVQTLSGWMIFDARTYDSDGNTDGEYYQMPIFDKRSIETDITVYDGETVVLGGVAQDKVEIVNDKIPVLGDLPIVGRLFQSKYTDSQKRNLLVFLTCRLVKPDGSAFFPNETRSRGIPEFGRNR